jgi:hypothetical protein
VAGFEFFAGATPEGPTAIRHIFKRESSMKNVILALALVLATMSLGDGLATFVADRAALADCSSCN